MELRVAGADNPALRAYYERAGFEHGGDVAMYGTTISRYERPVSAGAGPA